MDKKDTALTLDGKSLRIDIPGEKFGSVKDTARRLDRECPFVESALARLDRAAAIADWPRRGSRQEPDGEEGEEWDLPDLALTVKHLINRFIHSWGIDETRTPLGNTVE